MPPARAPCGQTFPTSSRLAALARPAANGAYRSSPTRPPHTPPSASTAAYDPHATATTFRPQERKTQLRPDLNAPLPGPRRTPFHPVAYTSRSDQPRAAPSAAAPAGRRRATSMSSPPAARRRPSVAAHSGHIPTRARRRTVIPNGAGQRRFVFPKEAGSWWQWHAGRRCRMRGRTYGPPIQHQAAGRTASTAMSGRHPLWLGRSVPRL